MLKHCVSPPGLCTSLITLYVSPLRHCTSCGTLCITLVAFCVDDAGPLASVLSLLGSLWPALASVSTSLPLRWSLGTISTSLSSTHCPSLLITDSTLLSNPALVNRMTNHWFTLQVTLKPPLILFLLTYQRSRLNP